MTGYLPYYQIIIFLLWAGISQAQPKMVFNAKTHDFGQIEEGTMAEYEFEFTNQGDAPLVISTVKASCGCTTPYWTKEPVMPGGNGVIKASYNSQNRPGGFNKTITVTANAANATHILYIKGVVIKPTTSQPMFTAAELSRSPKIEISNPQVDLGKVPLDNTHTLEFEVRNSGPTTLQIKGVQSACNCLRLHQGRTLTIEGGAAGSLRLDLLPSKTGDFTHQAKILSNDIIQPVHNIYVKVQVVQTATSIVKDSPSKITF